MALSPVFSIPALWRGTNIHAQSANVLTDGLQRHGERATDSTKAQNLPGPSVTSLAGYARKGRGLIIDQLVNRNSKAFLVGGNRFGELKWQANQSVATTIRRLESVDDNNGGW